jgi:ribose transport system ATP-binding protein
MESRIMPLSMSPDPGTEPGPLLAFHSIEKSFFGVKVVQGVSFEVMSGRALGLVGENGAGKSTLMNILGGNLCSDAGEMRWNGARYRPGSPREAERAGVAFIHQELNLFQNLTIAENLFIGGFPRRLGMIDRRTMRERARDVLREVQLDHGPDTPLEVLSAGERQLVEIAKALLAEARLIILDEPTTSLTSRETGRLFELVRQLRGRGMALIYISHNLEHVRALCDDLVILRDGQVVGGGPMTEFALDRVVSLMVGREITQFFPARTSQPTSEVVLDVRGVSQPGMVRDITLQLRRGEVLGVSGLMGSGRSELARILFGLDDCAKGEIRLVGALLNPLPPRERIARGMAFLTEDRRADGLCLDASVGDNITLVALDRMTDRLKRVEREASKAAVGRMREAVRLTPGARDGQPVKTLSGGNQQKVVLAKWILNEPKVFILDEPTRGIDVGAKCEVYRLINELVEAGAGVLMISSEVEELIGMCDRILVMNRGAIEDVVERGQFDRERILRAALHRGVVS